MPLILSRTFLDGSDEVLTVSDMESEPDEE